MNRNYINVVFKYVFIIIPYDNYKMKNNNIPQPTFQTTSPVDYPP